MKCKKCIALAISFFTALNLGIFSSAVNSANEIESNVNASATSQGVYSSSVESVLSAPETIVSLNGTIECISRCFTDNKDMERRKGELLLFRPQGG